MSINRALSRFPPWLLPTLHGGLISRSFAVFAIHLHVHASLHGQKDSPIGSRSPRDSPYRNWCLLATSHSHRRESRGEHSWRGHLRGLPRLPAQGAMLFEEISLDHPPTERAHDHGDAVVHGGTTVHGLQFPRQRKSRASAFRVHCRRFPTQDIFPPSSFSKSAQRPRTALG